MAFDAYDLGMTALRTLQKQKIITKAKYIEIKDKYGWPCWRAIKAADIACNTWIGSKNDANYDKMNTAFEAMYETQKLLNNQVIQLQGGK
jgi:hypothetical protein